MRICNSLDELATLRQDLHLAFGVFDGVHTGHQTVIRLAVQAAANLGGISGLVTFDPHPIRVIAPARAPRKLLATIDHKANIVRSLGLDLFVPLHFDLKMAAMPAAEFLDSLCRAPVKTIAVGEDWRFGHNRAGDVPFLRSQSAKLGFTLQAASPVMFGDDRISSTRIRQAIHDGNLREAARMLGRPYSISGPVLAGRKLGRTIGFPTANLSTDSLQLPPDGVWAVRVNLQDKLLDGVANLGVRPTVDGQSRTLEVHLLDFSQDLYGETIDVRFVKHLRPEKKFESLEALKNQITRDTEDARNILRQNHP